MMKDSTMIDDEKFEMWRQRLEPWTPTPLDTWLITITFGNALYFMVYYPPFLKFTLIPLHCVFGLSLLWYALHFSGSLDDSPYTNIFFSMMYSWRKIFVLTITYLPIPISYFYKVFG